MSEYEIRQQQGFSRELAEILPHQEIREEVLRGIRFVLRSFPDKGRNTGRATPVPVFAWTFHGTEVHPPLIVYYCFADKVVLLLSVKVTEAPSD